MIELFDYVALILWVGGDFTWIRAFILEQKLSKLFIASIRNNYVILGPLSKYVLRVWFSYSLGTRVIRILPSSSLPEKSLISSALVQINAIGLNVHIETGIDVYFLALLSCGHVFYITRLFAELMPCSLSRTAPLYPYITLHKQRAECFAFQETVLHLWW